MEFKDISMHGECDVCGKETDVAVCCSMFGPVSHAYCQGCLVNGLEPYWTMVNYISTAGRFPDDINERYQELCRDILNKLGITEEQFISDIDKSIKAMDEYFMSLEEEKYGQEIFCDF